MNSKNRVKLRPVLDGDSWMIGDNPDLGELNSTGTKRQECVDHYIFQTDDGIWHLWGCIRGTANGRVLYHWESGDITAAHWTQTGEYFRVDKTAGESLLDWDDEEWIQSPFVIRENGKFYMFYGGHTTGIDESGCAVEEGFGELSRLVCEVACQMCLMTSDDGRNWTRHKNQAGFSRLFIGPGEARDPALIKIDGLWHMYYAGCHFTNGDQGVPAFYVRTSEDLIHWSGWRVVHSDTNPKFGSERWNHECPMVVERGGYYYLFRTQEYGTASTHVFRSEDPFDFGIGDAADKYVGSIAVAAPEIIFDADGREYISSSHDLAGGTRLCKLKWIEE